MEIADPVNRCVVQLHALPIPRVGEGAGGEDGNGVLENSGMLKRELASRSGVEKVPILLGGDALCYAKQRLSEGRLLVSRLAPHLRELNSRLEAHPRPRSCTGASRGGRIGDLNGRSAHLW